MRTTSIVVVSVLTLFSIAGCDSAANGDSSAVRQRRNGALRVAVTTSTRDSGLLDVLVPVFENESGVRIDIIASGTGKALKLGESGDVDVVFVHSRQAEDAFMSAGHGVRREDVMFNTFEIVGPPNDPARIRGMQPVEAIQRIAQTAQRFISRGDASGTHHRELALWSMGGGQPASDRYVEIGQGMGATLTMADQLQAYTLTDRGTYLAMQKTVDLVPLVVAAEELKNRYGIIVVDPSKHDGGFEHAAQEFVDFLISPRVQRMIGEFKVGGESLFHPMRLEPQS